MAVIIRLMTPDDYAAVAKIYEEGIATGNATFQTQAADWASWDKDHLLLGRLIAENIYPDEGRTEGGILLFKKENVLYLSKINHLCKSK